MLMDAHVYGIGMPVTGSHAYDCVLRGKATVSVFPR